MEQISVYLHEVIYLSFCGKIYFNAAHDTTVLDFQ